MKIYRYYLHVQIINSLFVLRSKVDGVGSPPPPQRHLIKRFVADRSKQLLCFTTLSRFEKEEEEAECKIWMEIEENDKDDEFAGDDYDEVYDEDDDEIVDSKYEENFTTEKKTQRSWWQARLDNVSVSKEDDLDGKIKITEIEEHPIRTDEWLIKVKLSPFFLLPRSIERESALFAHTHDSLKEKQKSRSKDQIMKFSKNGYVILIDKDENDDPNKPITNNNGEKIVNVGKWHMNANGISWTMQALGPGDSKHSIEKSNLDADQMSEEEKCSRMTTSLYYHADIHLSKFQSRPRMLKGTITRDRYHDEANIGSKKRFFGKRIFRPVIASFTAEGIGEDTLALHYKERGFGLGNAGH